MTPRPARGELTGAYEALRAQLTGGSPAVTPRGLALFLSAGLPAWMDAWTSFSTSPRVVRSTPSTPASVASDLVRVLTEMAIGCQRRWATT